VIGTVEKHGVFSIIQVLSKEPMPYQFSTAPGEKCGLGQLRKHTQTQNRVIASGSAAIFRVIASGSTAIFHVIASGSPAIFHVIASASAAIPPSSRAAARRSPRHRERQRGDLLYLCVTR